ncbi:MAG: hypothetical protein CMF48_00810 [Legionellales bacterium]|nr:hypothetical protein [Legionellales bacterium]
MLKTEGTEHKKPGMLALAWNRLGLYFRPITLVPGVLTASFIYAVMSLFRQRPMVGALVLYMAHRLHFAYAHHPQLYRALHRSLFNMAKHIPAIGELLEDQLGPIIKGLEDDNFAPLEEGNFRFLTLPEQGISEERILAELDAIAEIAGGENARQKLSGAIYTGKTDFHSEINKRLLGINVMHKHLWPRLVDAENQSVAMCLKLYNAPAEAWGKTTAGGSLSIYEALSAYANQAKASFNTAPHIVLSDRAHSSFKKAAKQLGMSYTEVPVNPLTYQVDLKKMRAAIQPSTVLLVASAPAFPEGIMDDIEAVSTMALEQGIGCHMDACLGGGLLPFAQKVGLDLPACSFELPGVTSISADLHKFFEAPKGHSLVMFRDEELAAHGIYTDLQSKMGMYGTAGIEGSRPPRVAGWAVLLSMGVEGYAENLRGMMEIKNTIVRAIEGNEIPGLVICGKPLLPIFALKSIDPDLDIFLVASHMKSEYGWSLHALPEPAVHLCVTPRHLLTPGTADIFLKNLEASVAYAKENKGLEPAASLKMYDTFKHEVPDAVADPVLQDVGEAYFLIEGSAERRRTDRKMKRA